MTNTNPAVYYVIGIVVLIVIVLAIVAAMRRARSVGLHRRFGPEYDRLAKESGDRAAAERELARREDRVKKFHLEELPAGAKDRYIEEWRAVQSRFVDEPREALAQADTLITNAMRDRGYPIVNFEQRAADLSANHAGVVQEYRTAHDIAQRSEAGQTDTEDLRQAMVHYRALFTELVGADERTT
jgi:hypothetical protein